MKKMYVSGNYLVVGSAVYPLVETRHNEKSGGFEIYEKNERFTTTIKYDEAPYWYNEAGDTAYSEATMRTFLRTNTGDVVVTSSIVLPVYHDLSDDYTVLATDSGKTFRLDAIGEDITLPAVTVVGKYKFLCVATTATSDWTITAPTAVIQGSVDVNSTLVPASDESLVTLVVAKFLAGDYITLESDGVNYYIDGKVVTVAGCTLTAP